MSEKNDIEWQAPDESEGQRPEANEKTNRGWWMMKEWFSSFSPPLPRLCVYSEIVICHWWRAFLSLLRQPAPNHAQTDGGASNSNRDGMGGNQGQHPTFDVSPLGLIRSVTPLGWCWQMELRDTNPLGTVTQKYETQGGMSVKDEWLDERKLMYETTWKATASCHFCLSSCMTHNSNFMYLIVLIDNTFSLREEGVKKECHWTLRFPFPGWQVPQCYRCSSGHLF